MIICAAIKIKRPNEKEIIVAGYRHSDCLKTIWEMNPDMSREMRRCGLYEDGFLATGNRFLNRKQAYEEAVICGQLNIVTMNYKEKKNETILYSEDIY